MTTRPRRELTDAEVDAQLAAYDRKKAHLLDKKAAFKKQKTVNASNLLAHLPRDLETLCKIASSSDIYKLVDHLWATDGPDVVTMGGERLMDVIQNALVDVPDCFGIIFLDMETCTLHTFAYKEKNKTKISAWKAKVEAGKAVQVYAK